MYKEFRYTICVILLFNVVITGVFGIYPYAVLRDAFFSEGHLLPYKLIATLIALAWILLAFIDYQSSMLRIIVTDRFIKLKRPFTSISMNWQDIVEVGTYRPGGVLRHSWVLYLRSKESGDTRYNFVISYLSTSNRRNLIDIILQKASNAKFVNLINRGWIPFFHRYEATPWGIDHSGTFRPTQAGEPIQLIGESVAAPGAPWKIDTKPISLGPPSGEKYIIKQLAIGDFSPHPLFALSVLNAGIGPLYMDPSHPDMAGEVIYIYSISVPEMASRVKAGELDSKWLDKIKASVRDEIVRVYEPRGKLPHDIRDISAEYQEKLNFWPGYIIAISYTTDKKNYRVIHAFKYISASAPDNIAFQDFSFIRMDESSAVHDRFDDFVDMLRSSNLGGTYRLRPKNEHHG